jgi:DNA polymerase-3 subunit epsilon
MRISDDDVEDKPTFKAAACRILEVLTDCDLAGFNIATFDLPLLQEEFRRIGMEFPLTNQTSLMSNGFIT